MFKQKYFIKLLIVFSSFLYCFSSAQITHTFDSIYSTTARGNIVYAGNSILTCTTVVGQTGAANCTDARGGTNRANNQHRMVYIDIDGDPSTFNSSSADFSLPVGASVLFAGLFWGASSNNAARNQVKFKAGTGAYNNLTSDIFYNRFSAYHAYKDVTSIVATQAAGTTVTYTAADVQERQSTGQYGGWTLVVVISDNTQVPRNMTVFNGYARVRSGAPNNNITTTVSGFLTPPAGSFSTEVGVIAYEGDKPYTGDNFRVNGIQLSDAVNPNNNFFNSAISSLGAHVTSKNPNYQNQLGYDSKIVDVPYALGAIANGDTSASLSFRTTGDWYYPGVITFAVEVFQPVLTDNFSKIATDINGANLIPDDIVEYTMSFTNTGNDPATNVILTDTIPTNTSYVANSLVVVSDPNAANVGAKTDAAGDDSADIVASNISFRLGAGATALSGGTIQPGETAVVKFRVRVNSNITVTSISNQASIDYNGFTTGNAYNGLSDDPSTGASNDPTILTVVLPTITIRKTLIGSSQNFTFTSADADLDAISLTPVANGTASSSTFSKGAASYVISEDALINWQLTNFSCTGDSDSGTTVNLASRTATIDLDPGEDIVCTFTNTELGKIIINKVTSPAGIADSFSFSPSYTAGFNLTDGGSNDSGYILPNAYTVVENIGAAWELTGLSCVDPDSGSSTNLASATASIDLDPGETVSCTFTNDPLPNISITKTPNPISVPETGGSVTFSIQITNNTAEAITLDSLTDSVFGNLNGLGTCATGAAIAGNSNYSCSFSQNISGTVASPHSNTATVQVSDNETNSASTNDSATVNFTDVLPNITVNKSSVETSVDEPGGNVTYTFEVLNNTTEAITLQSLDDNQFGDLNGQGTCTTPQNIAGNSSYTCSSTHNIIGNIGDTHTNTVTADVTDDEGNTLLANDSLTIPFYGTQLTKSACNTSTTDCTILANFTNSVIANPTEIVEYRIKYKRIGSFAYSFNLSDTIPAGTTIYDSSYVGNTEVELVCPDASVVHLERSGAAAINIDLAAECTLNTQLVGGVLTEVLLAGEEGTFNFRVLVP